MSKKINFIPYSKDIYDLVDAPKSAINYVPDWIKQIPNMPYPDQDSPKKCMPFMDTFATGYIQELICDVSIKYSGRNPKGLDIIEYNFNGGIRPLSTRMERMGSNSLLPKFEGFYHSELSWNSIWEPHTPSGYSTFYTHPLNRPDLPFYTMTGIIDTDVYPVHGPIPFIIKEGFEGVIPAGTPIYQIFFIKREKWASCKREYISNFTDKIKYKAKRYFTGGYKKHYWFKKEYK
jgi:hypothetical protein